jgi:hypothetical protein
LPVPARPPRETIEDVAVAAHEPHLAAPGHPAEGRAALGVDDEPRVDRHVLHDTGVELVVVVELVHLLAAQGDLRLAGEAGVDGQFGTVLLGGEADRGGLDAQREVLGDDRDREPVVGEVQRDREDARVVVAELEARRQHRHVGVVELDPQRSPVAHGDREVEAFVLHAQLVEVAQRLAGEVPDLRVVALALEFADDDDRKDDRVLREAEDRFRIRQQDRSVEHVRALRRGGLRICRLGGVLSGANVVGHVHSIPE